MKRTLILLLAVFAFLPAVAQQTVQSALAQAQKAYLAGDIATAKPLFEQVLASDPKNVTARNYLRMIAVREVKPGSAAAVERQLQALILPEVKFENATFREAVNALRQFADKASEGKLAPSMVLKDPEAFEDARVTVHLRNIPFTEALRYVCDLGKAEYRVDQYAVHIQPKAKE